MLLVLQCHTPANRFQTTGRYIANTRKTREGGKKLGINTVHLNSLRQKDIFQLNKILLYCPVSISWMPAFPSPFLFHSTTDCDKNSIFGVSGVLQPLRMKNETLGSRMRTACYKSCQTGAVQLSAERAITHHIKDLVWKCAELMEPMGSAPERTLISKAKELLTDTLKKLWGLMSWTGKPH